MKIILVSNRISEDSSYLEQEETIFVSAILYLKLVRCKKGAHPLDRIPVLPGGRGHRKITQNRPYIN